MFLKALTIKGFKSFAEATTLDMEPGVTVVVGPNGSGKSNVVDAIGWVLGAQAPSAVRSQKMDDVIFAGTAMRPALGRAEVSLTIDNSAGLLPIEFAEVTISRTLFRAGDSEYSLNGIPCRLLDIQELLSDTGVGRQQHVIISQGQIDAVLNARPEDRRLIIEEAAGVLKFRRRKEKAERRLASTEGNLTRLQDLLREVRRQLRPLERQAEAARRHGELIGELTALRIYVAGRELATLRTKLTALATTKVDGAAREAELKAQLARLDTEVMAAGAELTAVALHRPPPFAEDRCQAACPLAQLLDPHQAVTDVVLATRRELALDRHHGRVEPRQLAFQLVLEAMGVDLGGSERLELGAQTGDLAARDVDPERRELLDEHAVASGGLGLAFEWSQLAADLAQQILDAQQVGLGRVEAALGLLLAAPVLEDAGSLLDDRPAVLGSSVEHGVDLPLADDHVLLAADAGVAQQLLHVEQAARDTIDRVLALAAAEQDAADRDLVELDGQQPGRVVDGEADLGPAERRARRSTGKDDVVHLLTADRLRGLGAEHPSDGVDDVRLARTVRSDDHGDAGLERHGRRVGERLEALEGETLEEHGDIES
ncbi:MAG TPA: AAA family ATPase [Ilumatobacter sp.]